MGYTIVTNLLVGLIGCSSAAARLELHVATNGDDSASRRLRAPFRTIERARDEICRLKKAGKMPDGGFTAEVHGGIYPLARPFKSIAEDSGTEQAPIVYRAQAGASVGLEGG